MKDLMPVGKPSSAPIIRADYQDDSCLDDMSVDVSIVFCLAALIVVLAVGVMVVR